MKFVWRNFKAQVCIKRQNDLNSPGDAIGSVAKPSNAPYPIPGNQSLIIDPGSQEQRRRLRRETSLPELSSHSRTETYRYDDDSQREDRLRVESEDNMYPSNASGWCQARCRHARKRFEKVLGCR
jgi:hypothetical protein